MKAPFDLDKLNKKVAKSIPGISVGFHDPKTWLDTGCYALNYLVSNDFNGGIPLEGKFTQFAGDSGSGKSYIASANLIKSALAQNVFPILIDTENAADLSWMTALGVDTEQVYKVNAASIDDTSRLIGELIDMYKERNDALPYDQRPKMLIIIDSMGMLITPNQEKQFMEGDQKGDMGIKAKQITNMLRVAMAKIASQPIGMVATNHVYDSQDKYTPDVIPGGKMLEFASSVIIQMNKYLLREDDDGNKLTDGEVAGIRSTVVVRKSRYAKPFEKVKINIPYTTGMDRYSGLFDLFEKKGLLVKEGISYVYTSPVTGEIFKAKRKQLKSKGIYDVIMSEREAWDKRPVGEGFDLSGEGEGDEE